MKRYSTFTINEKRGELLIDKLYQLNIINDFKDIFTPRFINNVTDPTFKNQLKTWSKRSKSKLKLINSYNTSNLTADDYKSEFGFNIEDFIYTDTEFYNNPAKNIRNIIKNYYMYQLTIIDNSITLLKNETI